MGDGGVDGREPGLHHSQPHTFPRFRSGQLDRKEFKAALKAAKLGLTRKDINLIMSNAGVSEEVMPEVWTIFELFCWVSGMSEGSRNI